MKIMITLLLLVAYQPSDISDDLTLSFEGNIVDTVNRSNFLLLPVERTLIDKNKYNLLLEKVAEQVYEEPSNASIDENGNIVSGELGHRLHRKKFTEKFYTYFFSSGSASMEIPVTPIYPKIDSELLAKIQTKRISHYVTFFNSNNKERTQNIQLASDAINNHVVFPGKIFSFNEVVGKRTAEKGYLKAPVIEEGELSQGIGGGICQVSSTLYNAVDRAGVRILERYSHSREVPYVPPGRDATVSWYGPDFTFKNIYNQPLLIRSKVARGQLVIVIYSSDTIETPKRKDTSDASGILPKEASVCLNTTT
ncbi:VanW family protein [Aquibacillus albus]|uniref:Vancomycin resistance protein YoaR n=1 Tax=Aquibacillus albus TaxID=1168171 RepID=A0ABS2N4K3_9BACI|nr:VanW family protein [Aquibacillus albus]MBM7573057.1 vancomycin resistance protein YoaR [Aquibacillus albus]